MTPASSPSRRGFTLIELLAVIGIMAILGTVVVAALNGSGSKALPAAQRTFSSLLTTARNAALTRQTQAWFLIHNDPRDQDRYLRYVGVVYDDPSTPAVDYIPASNGVYLPSGAYVCPSDIKEGVAIEGRKELRSDKLETLQIAYPVSDAASEAQWIVIGFDRNGMVSTSPKAPKVVLRPADFDGEEITFTEQGQFSSVGVYVRPTGLTMMINDFDEMQYAKP